MADIEMEKGYSGFERFMFFITPILFTVVLLGVLLTLFNSELRNKALEIGNKIPVLSNILPEPASADPTTAMANEEQQLRSTNLKDKITQLEGQLTAKDAALDKATAEAAKQTQQIKDLQSEIDQLKQSNETKLLSDQEYQNKISELANMYAKLSPSKAAPILEAMELNEAVLVLDAMRPDDRVSILEKMTPKTAAEVTVMLKDVKTAKDRQIAALQARIKKQESATSQSQIVLDNTQLNQTFSQMAAKDAAELLIKMAAVSPSKVLRILNAVDSAPRSNIIGEMSKLNDGITAQLVTKMMAGK